MKDASHLFCNAQKNRHSNNIINISPMLKLSTASFNAAS